MSVQPPPGPSSDSRPATNDLSDDILLFGQMMTILSPSVPNSEKRCLLERNPQLYAALLSNHSSLIADVFNDDHGKPLAGSVSCNVAVPNLPSTPMEISNSADNVLNSLQTGSVITAADKLTCNSVFIAPPNRLTAKKGMTPKNALLVPLANKFTNLAEETLNDPNVTAEPQNAPPVTKSPKIRPIFFTKTDNYLELIQIIAKTIDTEFSYTTNAKFVKIFPKSIFVHTKIAEFLKSSDFTGFFTPVPDIVPLKVVARGLDINTDLTELQISLADSGFTTLKIAQLTSKKSGTVKKLPLFQIQLLNNPHNKTILDLTSLNYRKIKIEPYRNSRRVLQCFNCQNFNHHQSNCYLPPRCLRCAQNHKSFECPNIIDKLPQPLCCNCGLHHPANYRGCAKFPKPRPFPAQKPINTDKFSYAQATRTTFPTPAVTPPTNHPRSLPIGQLSNSPLLEISNVLNEIEKELNVKSLFSLLQNLKSLLSEFKSETNQENKFFLLVQRLPTLFSFAP